MRNKKNVKLDIAIDRQKFKWTVMHEDLKYAINSGFSSNVRVHDAIRNGNLESHIDDCRELLKYYAKAKEQLAAFNREMHNPYNTDLLNDTWRQSINKAYAGFKQNFAQLEAEVNSIKPELERVVARADDHEKAVRALESAPARSILKTPPLLSRIFNFLKDSFKHLIEEKPKGYEVDHFVERPSTYDKDSVDYKKADPPHVQKRDLAEVNREFHALKIIDMPPKTSKVAFDDKATKESLGGGKGMPSIKEKAKMEAAREAELAKTDSYSPPKGP